MIKPRIGTSLIFLPIFLMLVSLTANVAFAQQGGHLWFYSQDPATLNPPEILPNPQDYDPHYVGSSSDAWATESIVIPPEDWHSPFYLWLACAQFESLNTKLVVSINDVAHGAMTSIEINDEAITAWDTSGSPPDDLAPHGVFNSEEFYGFALIDLGNLYSPPGTPYKVQIKVEITTVENPPDDMKIHFDAYGTTANGGRIFSPYSHDFLFIIPEPSTVLAFAAPLSAFAAYAYRRRK